MKFDVIVVGGGHAGTEAALAAARVGASTLLITHNIETLGAMSCNPSIGGIGKGHLVREVDALGGIMGRAADCSGIQFRTLNASKGQAVRATRAQVDRNLYREAIRHAIENQPKLTVFQQSVDGLLMASRSAVGVRTKIGVQFNSDNIILTAGTFLNGLIHVGMEQYPAGRFGDPPSLGLPKSLSQLDLPRGRLKTGTPPRLDGRTIKFAELQRQDGDNPAPRFSFLKDNFGRPRQIPCWITHTNPNAHQIILKALDRSPLYTGKIQGVGPRYCPSIEDKIHRFAGRDSHQVFLEPEGLATHEYYPQGISTSLPYDVQLDLLHSIKGLESVHVTRPGYAIEYDYFDPRQLKSSLESKVIEGLFFAGQVNGTTGYEEAAGQGLIAGLNAARRAKNLEPWVVSRDQAYLGVMIDDLVTRGVSEPYRMFTSRAESRLYLREDNADLRLTEVGRGLGLVDDSRWASFEMKREAISKAQNSLRSIWVNPAQIAPEAMDRVFGKPLEHEYRLSDLLVRPAISLEQLAGLVARPDLLHSDPAVNEQLEVQAKYAGYIARQTSENERMSQSYEIRIPSGLDYSQVHGLAIEVRQRLTAGKPETIGQAARMQGITPAAIALLLVHLKKYRAI